jgi:hypothetical protein
MWIREQLVRSSALTVVVACCLLLVAVAHSSDETAAKSDHWAYASPRQVRLPSVRQRDWCRNSIDYFVLHRLEAENLSPSVEADRATLLRRVSLDLIGLPPTVEELNAFLLDDSVDAYERAVDRLLGSPAFGERWSIPWLDAARYADSNGFQRDGHRIAWPYRDWVIRALNADLPFDQFTVEQLAGDLLPNATIDQRIATGFHRGTTVNTEAGTDQEENRVNQVIDRVNVTGTVWLGTTLECCQCHDHKFDPFTQTEYYQLFAFFNNTEMETKEASSGGAAREFIGPSVELPDTVELAARRAAAQALVREKEEECERHERSRSSEFDAWQRKMTDAVHTGDAPKELTPALVKILKTPEARRTKKQIEQLRAFFFDRDADLKKLRQELARSKQELERLNPPTSLVMVERDPPRETRLFKRGNFEMPGEVVTTGTPRELPGWSADLPSNRLGLARWLVQPDNPLIARVTVNRWWAELFGRGLHATPEDFGVMAEEPLHRELLDWLAVEFVRCGWSMKHVVKLMVTSATYRQSSRVTADLLRRDPKNELLARGPRHRLTAELIRDQALLLSGLLTRKLGGPPVYPPQPANIWRVTGAVDNKYPSSTGPDRYRRGVYTVWRRSSPYPSFVNFDAPDRAACVVKRPRTNTPLQALTLLNDPVYVEAAVALAELMQSDDVSSGVEAGFRRCLSRSASSSELATLQSLWETERARFEQHPVDALRLLGQQFKKLESGELARRAAWVSVSNALLNLDELITKG